MSQDLNLAMLNVCSDEGATPLDADYRQAIAEAIQFLLLMRELHGVQTIDALTAEGNQLAHIHLADPPQGAEPGSRQQRRGRARRRRSH